MTSQSVLAKFRRVTSSGKFISEIDGLRFIAIGTVILFHLNSHPRIGYLAATASPFERHILLGIFEQGFHGVQLFFIISGFILAYPFAMYHFGKGPHVDLKQYFLRRVTRLEPPYMVCMVGFFALWVLFKNWNVAETLPHLLASLGYAHNLIYAAESTVNNVAWSLEIEIQFYILVPLLTLLFALRNKTYRRSLIAAICAVSILGHTLFFASDPRLSLTVLNHLHFFLLGFLLADIFIIEWNEAPKRSRGWDIVSLVGWPLLFIIWNLPKDTAYLFSFTEGSVVEAFTYPACAFLLYCAVFRGTMTNAVLTNPWITTIGGMCYTIYLLHNHVIGFIVRFTSGLVHIENYSLNYLVQSILVLPLLLLVCAVYFILIEKPCMRKDWPRRLYASVTGLFGGKAETGKESARK